VDQCPVCSEGERVSFTHTRRKRRRNKRHPPVKARCIQGKKELIYRKTPEEENEKSGELKVKKKRDKHGIKRDSPKRCATSQWRAK